MRRLGLLVVLWMMACGGSSGAPDAAGTAEVGPRADAGARADATSAAIDGAQSSADATPADDATTSMNEDAAVAEDAAPDEDAAPARDDAAVAEDAAPTHDDAAPAAPDAAPAFPDAAPALPDAAPALADAAPAFADAAPAFADAAPAFADAAPAAPDAALPDAAGAPDAGLNISCARRPGITPAPTMSFFATSVGTGAAGGDLGGLAGADARCACLAASVGITQRTWHAYLSVAAPLVNARDRIGAGPWFNFAGVQVAASVAALHASGLDGSLVRTEDGQLVPDVEHDILTGSDPDGTPHLNYDCFGWTDGTGNGYAWVGHPDWNLPNGSGAWNAAHESQCSAAGLAANGGAGRLYCFAL